MTPQRFDVAALVNQKRDASTKSSSRTTGPDSSSPAPRRRGRASTTDPAQAPQEPAEKSGEKPARAPRSRSKTSAAPAAHEPAQGRSEVAEPPAGGAGKRGPVDPPEPGGFVGEKRVNLPLQGELHRDLALARIDDGIEATIRVRAMIELWRHDPRLRKRVDKLAAKRATTIQRGRPRKDAS